MWPIIKHNFTAESFSWKILLLLVRVKSIGQNHLLVMWTFRAQWESSLAIFWSRQCRSIIHNYYLPKTESNTIAIGWNTYRYPACRKCSLHRSGVHAPDPPQTTFLQWAEMNSKLELTLTHFVGHKRSSIHHPWLRLYNHISTALQVQWLASLKVEWERTCICK